MIETILAIVGSLGGFELIKFFVNRKTNQRVAIAEAEAAEFHMLQETVLFLQQQLKEKEERFAEQTQLVRRLNAEVIELTKDKGQLEVEMVSVRCDDRPCPFRLPPNAYTQPKQGYTKEQYVQERRSGESNNDTSNSNS